MSVLKQLDIAAPDAVAIIVNNGSDLNHQPVWANEVSLPLHFIHSETNKGSAWAFGQGVKLAIEEGADILLLLDDDNFVEDKSISTLLNAWQELKSRHSGLLGLMSVHKDRTYLKNVANGSPVDLNFPGQNEFLGFSLKKLLANLQKKKALIVGETKDLIAIPCAPYGGFLTSANVIKQIGLPDERFFVYADDFEFTYRITAKGGAIYLATNSSIKDLTSSWNHASSRTFLRHKFLYPVNDLTYMSIRNSIYFQRTYLTTNRWVFNVNRYVFTLYLFILAIFTFRFQQFGRFQKAVKEGLNGVFNNQQYL